MSITEGKQPLTFQGYRFLAKLAIKQSNDFSLSIFAWVFLVLCWNLIARCNSVASIMLSHITWKNDSLVVIFPSHKGDPDGSNSLPKHVYANLVSNEICPILALAVFIFCMGFRRTGSNCMLFGEIASSESKFSRWLNAACIDKANDLLVMGIIIANIGTHSFRKGIATFVAGVSFTSVIAIYLRAGWSLGRVQSRYVYIIYIYCIYIFSNIN